MKWKHSGKIDTTVIGVIPFLLYFSKSTIKNNNSLKAEGFIYTMHVTPFIALGFTCRG